MTKQVQNGSFEDIDYDSIAEAIPYIIAGMQGRTDGNEIVSVTIQRTDNGAYRAVVRGRGFDGSGSPVHLVAFTNGNDFAGTLLGFEAGYRDSLVRWHLDRFSNGASKDGPPKTKKLSIK